HALSVPPPVPRPPLFPSTTLFRSEAGDEARLRHILDVQDDEPAVPVRVVEPVAAADRMMAAVEAAFPVRGLTARDPLARHPPPSDLLGLRGIGEIEGHHDVAAIALE